MEMLRNPQAMQARMNDFATAPPGSRLREAPVEASCASAYGSLDMLSCEISPEALETSDGPLLQDLVRAAYNDAARKVKEAIQNELTSGMDGIPLPPGMFGGLG